MAAQTPSPELVANLWRDRLSGATDRIRAGVANVRTAPGQAAAAQRNLWLQRIQASADKWARNVSSVSLQDWQHAMTEVGIPRIATGAQAHVGKMQRFMTDFLPYVSNGAAQVRQMPKGTVEQGIARAAAQIRWNAQYKRGAGGAAAGTTIR
jgi:hypothetical protein